MTQALNQHASIFYIHLLSIHYFNELIVSAFNTFLAYCDLYMYISEIHNLDSLL